MKVILYIVGIAITLVSASSVGAIPAMIFGFLVVVIGSMIISQSELSEIKSRPIRQTPQSVIKTPSKNPDTTELKQVVDSVAANSNKREVSEMDIGNWIPQAKQGNAQAQFNLGVSYEKGNGVTQDFQQAADWYLKAAEQGFTLAEFNLGVLHAKGQGVTKDLIEAYKWFYLAGAVGDSNGIKNCELLEKILRPDQMAEAKQRASAWMVELLKRTGVQVIEQQTHSPHDASGTSLQMLHIYSAPADNSNRVFRFFGEALSANLYGIKAVNYSLDGSEEAIKVMIGNKESKIQQAISDNRGAVQAHLLALQAAAFYVCANQLSSSKHDVLTEVAEGIADGFSAVLGEINCALYDLFKDYAHSLYSELHDGNKEDVGFSFDMGATTNLVVDNIGGQCDIKTLLAGNLVEKLILAEVTSRCGMQLLLTLLNGDIAYTEPTNSVD